MANAVMEMNIQQTSDSSLASLSTRSHAQIIDSIPLDDPSGEKINEAAPKCNHFSIRAYVAELRKRDPKLCDPFSPYRDQDGSMEPRHELPPMVAPEFQTGKCDGCIPGSGSPTVTDKQAHISADDKLAYPSKHFVLKESATVPPGRQNAEPTSTSSDSDNNQNCPQPAMDAVDRKGKGKAHVEDVLLTQTGCKENGIVEIHHKNSSSYWIETGASNDYVNDEDGEVSLASLPDLNECNKAPSDDDDQNEVLFCGNSYVCEEEDDYLGVDRRKAPKVRLLSELLGTKETNNDAQLNKRSNPLSSDFPGFDAPNSGVSDSQPLNKNAKKKKLDSQEELRSMEINGSNNGTKKFNSASSEVSESMTEDEYSIEIITEALVKKRSKPTLDGKPLPEKRNIKKIKTDNGGSSFSPQLNITPNSSNEKSKSSETNHVCNGSVVGKHTMNASVKEVSLGFRTSGGAAITDSQFDGTRELSTGLKTSSKGKEVRNPEAEEGSVPSQHGAIQVSSSVMNEKGVTRHIQDIDINSIPADDKVPEQGKGDDSHDIPMDIVELLAKNQYERNLGEPKGKHHSVSLFENARANGSTKTYGEEIPELSQPHFFNWQNLSSKDTRKHVFEPRDSSTQKLLSPFSEFNQTHLSFGGHLREKQVSDRSFTFSQSQVPPYSAFGLKANNWTGHMGAQQRCSAGFLQTMRSNNTCRESSSRQPIIEACIWPSLTGGKKDKCHHQGPSILNFSTVSLEKQDINFSDTRNGGNKQIGPSLDSYSNEVIPAMHLLSLMQSAGKSDRRVPSLPGYWQYNQHPSSQDSRHPLRECNGRTSTMHDTSFHQCYNTNPSARSFASSFPSSGGNGRKSDFLTPIPLTSHGKRNIGSSHFASLKPQEPVSCNVGRKQQLDSALDKGKGISGMSNPAPSTDPIQGSKDSANNPYELATKHAEKTICPTPQKEVCVLNQNPSEFNDLKELRRYMIRPEDLRARRTRQEKSVQRGNAKRQEIRRMNKHFPCLIRKITTEVSSM